ncbi:enoyl-CoA hydratase/isomerase family protein [Candidatus Mycobacterium wuenschmannii]|uniref:Enoyl-CoA hydratase/isomerase family protein n=1 Tax=Candidatus Mycobacterium wuenschmannii TaxID=3027808 RepID=A0ABY8VYD4_9MYCO|nr:enoyl-CoA hydratase/isomerase family protein [Candidatus Mycobacterium wuenschmannii]WIM88106.1 enoyl-CoA hydratase/isomerase family protein [Candidatus Mycobacterium wuenschmannii]
MSHHIRVEVSDDHVATVEFARGDRNHFDAALIADLADTFERLDADAHARAIVLCSSGRHFCAGADLPGALSGTQPTVERSSGSLYDEAARLFAARTPVVAAVQGAAVGGGLGLALVADFRVAGPSTRFVANFSRLGLHQGFGITVTLPAVVGAQRAQELLYTGRAVPGAEATSIGLCDRLAADDTVRSSAHAFAAEIAASAPLAVASIRQTLRGDLADRVRAATAVEQTEQIRLAATADFVEGVTATAERREPRFVGS